MVYSLRPVCHLYGGTLVQEFGPLALKAVRQVMMDGYTHPKYGPQERLSRGVINHRINRIQRVFKWGVENERVPSVLQALQAVHGLERGRTKAKETAPVKPVSEAVVKQTLPHASRQVAAMARIQLLTGARPGEVCVMRTCDVDMSGPIWLYRPGSDQGDQGQHKTAHHGHQRIIAIGPKAQAILRPFLKLNLTAYLFAPREAEEERLAGMRRKRKTRVQPSQQTRKKKRPRKVPGERYDVAAYDHAIKTACDHAFPPPEPLAKREGETIATWQARLTPEQKEKLIVWQKAHRWHPHQLRHTAAATGRGGNHRAKRESVWLGQTSCDSSAGHNPCGWTWPTDSPPNLDWSCSR